MSETEKTYPISEAAQYDTKIRKLQNTDPANADEIFNPLIQKIIDNIHAVKLSDDTKAKEDLSNVLDTVLLEKVKKIGGSGSKLDADTVDGKHAADFAPAGFGLGTSCTNLPSNSDLNDLPEKYKNATGFFMGSALKNQPTELASRWIYLLQMIHYTTHKLQIAFTLNGEKTEWGNIFIRHYINNVWSDWKKPDASTIAGKDIDYLLDYNNLTSKPVIPTTLPANGGNADTVDGKHAVDLQNYNNLTNKPTIPTTLPANGGNADTVDGKHASDFAPAGFGLGTNCETLPNGSDLNNLPEKYKYATGFFMVTNSLNKPAEVTSSWLYVIQLTHYNTNILQICSSLNYLSEAGNIYIRCYYDNIKQWSEWKKPDAATVGGKHATDFAPSGFGLGAASITIPENSDLNNLPENYKKTGFFSGGELKNKPPELAGWFYLIQIYGSEMYKLQLTFGMNGSSSIMGDIFIRQCVNGVWSTWKKPDAATVGGKSAAVLQDYNNLTNKLIINNQVGGDPPSYDKVDFDGCNIDIISWYGLGIFSTCNNPDKIRSIIINARNGDIKTKGQIYAATDKKVWHEGNDGSGSGLDADMLDGKHAAVLYANCSTVAPTSYLGDNVQYQVY